MLKRSKVIIGIAVTALVVGGGIAYALLFPSPYKGWETYRDEKAGYSVKYPKGFVVDIRDTKENYYGNKIISAVNFYGYKDGGVPVPRQLKYDVSMGIDVYENPENLSLEEWVDVDRSESPPWPLVVSIGRGITRMENARTVDGHQVIGLESPDSVFALFRARNGFMVIVDGDVFSIMGIKKEDAIPIFNLFLDSITFEDR